MINNLPNGLTLNKDKRYKHRVVISNSETGEVLYDNESLGGVVCSIEQITSKTLTEIEGVHQIGCFGDIREVFYGIDQLNKWFFEHSGEFIDQMFDEGVLKSTPEMKEKMKESILSRMRKTWMN